MMDKSPSIKTTEQIQLGDQAAFTRAITGEMVAAYADLIGDHNPVHLDDAYAATTRFGKRIAHGMLVAGLISTVIASELPGAGSVYLGQTLQFKAPVFLGDTITATVTVRAIRPDKPIVTLATTCTNQDGKVVIEGEAVVLVQKT
jgi:acyl dehydratase